MDLQAERAYLEKALQGKAKPKLSLAATCGRLAEINLDPRFSPTRPDAALVLARAGLGIIAKDDALYPKLRHLEAMALRTINHPPAQQAAAWVEAAAIDREVWPISLDAERWDEAGQAFADAQRALHRFQLRQTLHDRDRLELQEFARYPTKSAYALAKAGKHTQAIVMLERSADIVFNASWQRRDIKRLETTHPDVAKRLSDAHWAMQKYQAPAMDEFGLNSYGQLSTDARRDQAALNEIVNEIRALPGFASFALPSAWSDVEAAAAKAQLIYLVPTSKGTMCLAVKHRGGDKCNIVYFEVDAKVQDIGEATLPFFREEFGGDPQKARDTLIAAMDYLGRTLMAQVRLMIQRDKHDGSPVVMIPFGVLQNLPIHATFLRPDGPDKFTYLFHPHDIRFAFSARNFLDSCARRDEPIPSRALVIDNPQPLLPPHQPLLLSGFEVDALARRFSCTVIAGKSATTERVCDALPAAELVHFSCHGSVIAALNYSGGLLLANGEMLAYPHLRQIEPMKARMVVLSACVSGVSSPTMEYKINLPIAFLAAGAAAVLGTFWHADEMASLLLVDRFYQLWTGGRAPLAALGDAQEWLMTSPRDVLIAAAPAKALASPAAQTLVNAPEGWKPFAHPWYWAAFFLAGV
jgi:hypothetical protein